jgi:uncharacterized protein
VEWTLTALIFLAALLYASVGHAGASGYLAAMALYGIAPATMKPTALVLNLLVASIGTVQFARANRGIAWATLWPFALGSVPLAFVGGLAPPGGWWYRPLVGLVLLIAAARLVLPEKLEPRDIQKPSLALQILLGGVIGLLAGLTGTGGGIFLTPLLLLTGWESGRRAAGVSAAFILLNSLAGLAARPQSVLQLPTHFWFWALAALVGGSIGAALGSRRLSPVGLRRMLAIVMLVAAGKLIFSK